MYMVLRLNVENVHGFIHTACDFWPRLSKTSFIMQLVFFQTNPIPEQKITTIQV